MASFIVALITFLSIPMSRSEDKHLPRWAHFATIGGVVIAFFTAVAAEYHSNVNEKATSAAVQAETRTELNNHEKRIAAQEKKTEDYSGLRQKVDDIQSTSKRTEDKVDLLLERGLK